MTAWPIPALLGLGAVLFAVAHGIRRWEHRVTAFANVTDTP